MLPHNLHRSVAIEAMQAGKHVLLEKPMAPTLYDAKAILDEADQCSTVFMMAENSQYWPEVLAAKNLIADGTIGEVISGRGWHHGAHTPEGEWAKRGVNGEEAPAWRYSKDVMGGGVVVDGGAHWIRPLRLLLGEVEQVVGTTARPVSDYEGESLGRALLRHASGVTSVYEASVLPPSAAFGPMAAGWQIIGTKGEIRIDAGSVGAGSVMLWSKSFPDGKDMSPQPKPNVEIVDVSNTLLGVNRLIMFNSLSSPTFFCPSRVFEPNVGLVFEPNVGLEETTGSKVEGESEAGMNSND